MSTFCAAIEIGRRGYKNFVKGWFYPKLVLYNNLPDQWKKMVSDRYESWVELFNDIKKMDLRYHFSWKECRDRFRVLRFRSTRSNVLHITPQVC